MQNDTLKTITEIANELGVLRHRVVTFVDSNEIMPCEKVGNTFRFDADAQRIIREHFAPVKQDATA